jgi:hypothetical protein
MLDQPCQRRAGPYRAGALPFLRHQFLAVLALVIAVATGIGPCSAQDGNPEYQKKAQFIGKLARYVEWPQDKLGNGVPFVIGIFGNDQASDQIKEIISGRRIKDREVVVKHCATIQEIAGCHVLFVSRSEEARLGKILGEVRGDPVLTVGECDSFIKKGGIINLRAIGGNVSMELNERNARRSSLKLSPMLADFQKGPGNP